MTNVTFGRRTTKYRAQGFESAIEIGPEGTVPTRRLLKGIIHRAPALSHKQRACEIARIANLCTHLYLWLNRPELRKTPQRGEFWRHVMTLLLLPRPNEL